MKPEIPQSARDALARRSAADEHPSADLLNGFIEHALSATEQKLVTSHLAACAECREVVFLAGTAVEAERQVAAVAASRREPVAATPERRWSSWKWLVPALTVIVVVAGVVVERQRSAKTHPAADQSLARNDSLALSTAGWSGSAAGQPKVAAPTSPAQSSEGKATTAPKSRSTDREGQREKAQAMQREALESMSERSAVTIGQQPATSVVGGAVGAATPTSPETQSAAKVGDSWQRRTASATPTPAARTGAPAASHATATARAFAPMLAAQRGLLNSSASWRITDDGHLERSAPSGTWTRVLADQPVAFRAVGVIGNDVWAGGDGGALFHSADAGESWTRVILTADGQPEVRTIVSIRFDSALQGSVTTDSGTTWMTSDGGKSWSRRL
jgi:hypothetical protein